jgi:hypothetical protein
MKTTAILVLIFAMSAGSSRAAGLKITETLPTFVLPALRRPDVKISNVSVSEEPERVAATKSMVSGPAKSAGDTDVKDPEPKKGDIGMGFGPFSKGPGSDACYDATPQSLSQEYSLELCAGAVNTAPADCYDDTPGALSKENSVRLCKGAVNTAPAACYRATPRDLSPDLSVTLCKGAVNLAPPACYGATPDDLSRDLSVTLCGGARDTAPAACYNEKIGSMSQEDSVKACRPNYLPPNHHHHHHVHPHHPL